MRRMTLPKYILISLIAFSSIVWVTSEFTAAVFEHRYRHDINAQTPHEVVQSNLRFYKIAAKLASEKDVDIIVFNEYGLFPYQVGRHLLKPYMEHVPDPKMSRHNPCLEKELFQDRLILSSLSCLARENKMYVVANMGDIHSCTVDSQTCDAENVDSCKPLGTSCSDDGVLMYNTDVVFDVEGSLIARYHKVHPYFELLNVPDEPEFSTFETSFGTFGLIVCFDCIFKESVILSEKYNIDTLLFPTFWFDDIAPFNAPELQQSWALANQVNFIAANAHMAGNASLGSGIYSKDYGAVAYTYDPDGESKLVIGKISKAFQKGEVIVVREEGVHTKEETGDYFPQQCYDKLKGPPSDMITDYTCYKSQTENHVLVKLNEPQGKVKACDNEFCCSLTYDAIDLKEDYYLAVRNFTNDVRGFYHWCEETCLLVRCDPFEGKPCVLLPPTSNTVFKSLEMRAGFTAERVYATISKNKHRLAPDTEWSYAFSGAEALLRFQSDSETPLLKAGFFGRCYQRDPPFKTWY